MDTVKDQVSVLVRSDHDGVALHPSVPDVLTAAGEADLVVGLVEDETESSTMRRLLSVGITNYRSGNVRYGGREPGLAD